MKQTLFKNRHTLLLFTLLLALLSCSDNERQGFTPTLPEATQTGENTFGAYIDGKLLTPRDGKGTIGGPGGIPKGMRFIGNPPSLTYNEIRVQDYKGGTGGIIKIHIANLHQNGEGAFTIKESNCEDGIDANPTINIHCRMIDEATQTYKWYCSIENAGTLTITRYDYDNGIISGTFSSIMQNKDDSSDIIEITQGRFDINGYTLDETDFP